MNVYSFIPSLFKSFFSSKKTISNNLLEKASHHASSNIIFQILMRLFTFFFNAILLNYISAYSLGVINVRLMLLYSTIQFISREPTRRVCISEWKSNQWSVIINMIWLNLPVSLIIGYLFAYIWIYWLYEPDSLLTYGYSQTVLLIPIAVAIEMISEPMFIYSQINCMFKLKIYIEGISLIFKCVLMTYFVQKDPLYAIIIFGYSLLLSSILYTFLYHFYFFYHSYYTHQSYFRFWPFFKVNSPWLDLDLMSLNWSFYKQTILKQILTEGEKIIMTFLNPLTFAEQGIYDVVNNLSSLAARFIFNPIEESSYLLFANLINREKSCSKQDKEKYTLAKKILMDLFKLMSCVGLIFVVFGYNYSQLGLMIYNKKILGHGISITLMRFHCIYIYFIAINGITECFTFSAMNRSQINKYNKVLVVFSLIYIVFAIVLAKILRGPGLIVANCVNMLCRIIYGLVFISKYQISKESFNLRQILIPNSKVIFSLIIIFGITRISEMTFCCDVFKLSILHLTIGCLLFFIHLYIIKLTEPKLKKFISSFNLFKFCKKENSKKQKIK